MGRQFCGGATEGTMDVGSFRRGDKGLRTQANGGRGAIRKRVKAISLGKGCIDPREKRAREGAGATL